MRKRSPRLETLLKGIARYDEELAERLERMKGLDEETAGRLLTIAQETEEWGLDPKLLGRELIMGIRRGQIDHDLLKKILPVFEATIANGEEPADVAWNFFTRSWLSKRGRRKLAERAIAMLHYTAQQGVRAAGLGYTVADCAEKDKLTESRFRLMVPHLISSADEKVDPQDLLAVLSAGLKSKSLNRKTLPIAAERVRGVLEDYHRTGREDLFLRHILVSGLKSGFIDHENIGEIAELARKGMQGVEDNRVDPHHLSIIMATLLREKAVSMEGLPTAIKTARGIMKAHSKVIGRPQFLSSVMSSSIGAGLMDSKDLDSIGGQLKELIEAHEKAGHDIQTLDFSLEPLLRTKKLNHKGFSAMLPELIGFAKKGFDSSKLLDYIERGVKDGSIKAEALPALMEHAAGHANQHDPTQLTIHGLEAQKMTNAPMDKIFKYQDIFMKHNQFPSAKMVARYHKEFGAGRKSFWARRRDNRKKRS